MKKIFSFILIAINLIFLLGWYFTPSENLNINNKESVKVSLREAGHQLLLANNDSTSLVLPIIQTGMSSYQLSFQSEISIEPDSLVSIIRRSFDKASLSNYYIVEVLQCENKEVAYSFRVVAENENNIIPCRGRNLPETCYTILIDFTKVSNSFFTRSLYFKILGVTVVLFLINILYFRKKSTNEEEISQNNISNYILIGKYKFYETQNKLIKEAIEINLSKKECELLAILASQPNQVVKRDELTKRVWEDHGVIVGRSLDTYISKLRKKLKEDASIKITNVHGVGYKLEI